MLRISEILYSAFSTVVAWSAESVQIVRNKCEQSHRVDMNYQIYLHVGLILETHECIQSGCICVNMVVLVTHLE